jgi:hypothetical protein
MTTMRERRCAHCGDVYVYYPSGPPSGSPINDDRHCPVCKKAIIDALREIPRKRSRTWIEVKEPDYETIKRWEAEWDEVREQKAHEAAEDGRICITAHRLHMPLFDVESGAIQRTKSVGGREGFAGRSFRYVYWTDNREPPRVEEEMERNHETGAVTPWKDYLR